MAMNEGRQKPAEHSPRREIDMALGAIMGLCRCSEHEALETIVGVVHTTGVGLSGASRALITVVNGLDRGADSAAIQQWRRLVGPHLSAEPIPLAGRRTG